MAAVRDVAVTAFDDWFAKMMPDAEKWIREMSAEPVVGRPAVEPMNELPTVRKISSVVQVPNELLMDAGLIPDTRPKPPPLPWRWRVRNRIADWRERAACRAFKIIAGYDVPEQEDW